MKESKLTPFDVETVLMVKSVTGHEPEITEKAELFEMRIYVDDRNEYIVEAAIDAVIGRYGMRVRAVEHIREEIFLRGATFFIEYEKGLENLTNEEKEELRKKALFLTNTAYLLADMAHTCVFYADDKLNHLGKCFEKGEKMRFKKAAKLTKEAFKAVKEITEPLYNITDVDNACIDSDYLLEVIQLVINRTDETEESKTAMLEYIKKLPQIEHIEV